MQKESFGLAELRRARRSANTLLISVFLFSILVNVLMLTGPLFMMQVYDRVLGSRAEETLIALFVLVVLLFVLMGALDYARGRVLARFGARFQSDLDGRVFQAVIKRSLNPGFRSSPATGLRDLETIQSVLTSPAMLALFDMPWTPMFIGAIFIFHPLLGWTAVAGGSFLIAVALLNNWLTRTRTERAQQVSRQAHGFAEQARQSSEIVRSQGMGRSVLMRWHMLRGEALDQSITVSDWTGLSTAITKAARLLLQSTMLAVGAWVVLKGELTGGAMIAGSILLGRALAPIEQSIGQWPQIQRSMVAWKTLGTFLESTPPDGATTQLPTPTSTVSLHGVSVFANQAKRPILANLNLSIPTGQVVGIIGKSGSGKSTLAKALLGLLQPVAGEIRFGGATLDQYDIDELGAFVGYLPQSVSLFSGTVAENIARMSIEPNASKVVEAAKRANAHDMILGLPDGYQTLIQGQDSQLSGGQRQRIALARALYNDPVLLVLDEPNSALDADGSDALNLAVREFKSSERTVIIMTHRPMAIAECDRLVVLDGGQIVADGPRNEILKTKLQNSNAVQNTIKQAQIQ